MIRWLRRPKPERVSETSIRWVYVMSEPCEWCEVWIGKHRHSGRGRGTVDALLEGELHP